MEFLLYPTTVKMLAAEIIAACDAYISRKIGVEVLRELVFHYAENYPDAFQRSGAKSHCFKPDREKACKAIK
jgi:uncharacterized protein (TIGR04540 family)